MNFFVYGIPKAQPRVKAARIGGFTRVYTPKGADDWKTLIRMACLERWDGIQLLGPIKLTIDIYFQRPKSHFKKGALRPDAPEYHQIRPDFDNLEKAVADALTNVGIWRDDSQVAWVRTKKFYANTSVVGAMISIEPI